MAKERRRRLLFRLGRRGVMLGGLLWATGCASPSPHETNPLLPAASTALSSQGDAEPRQTGGNAPQPSSPASATVQQALFEEPTLAAPHPPAAGVPKDRFPLDLPTALRLAGANNLQIALADERVRQARVRLQGAELQWLPSLDVGVGYNNHAGTIQDTGGNIIETRRSSVFVGGGPAFGPAAVTGGEDSSRFVVGAPLADLLFAPLAERQAVKAADAARAATFNDTLLQVGLAYLDLLQAQEQVAVAHETAANAAELARLVDSRVRAGAAPPADGLRVQAEAADRRRQDLQAQEAVAVASTELTRLLRLDPSVALYPLETQPAPVDLVDPSTPLPALISQGLTQRPELEEHQALVAATLARLRQEQWRPWIPNLEVAYSAGGYAGGQGSFFGDFGGRGDFDALLVWQLRNLGFGNRALQRDRASQNLQARLTGEQMQDRVAAEVAGAYNQVAFRRREIEAARAQVKAAAGALPLNLKGVVEGTLRAVEAQQAVQALAAARTQYLAAVVDYNRAQFQLLRAVGAPLEAAPPASKPGERPPGS